MKGEEYIKHNRRDFYSSALNEYDLPDDPYSVFKSWFDEAASADILDANAMVISTSVDNMPESRVVLLRDFSEDGLIFYTNYTSDKSKAIIKNPNVSANFFWAKTNKQIRVQGQAKKVSEEQSDAYFRSRPYESKIGAWASDQSNVIENRTVLEDALTNLKKKYPTEVPRPKHWGGFIIEPTYFEFWLGKPSRLHDRIVYKKENSTWVKHRLAP